MINNVSLCTVGLSASLSIHAGHSVCLDCAEVAAFFARNVRPGHPLLPER